MSSISRISVASFASLVCALACGGGSSGHSSVDQQKMAADMTLEEQTASCQAWADYVFASVGSADDWCRWHGQNNTSGTTDSEVQATCAVAEATCLAEKDKRFADVQAQIRSGCDGAAPLSTTFMRSYAACSTTVGKLEACGMEQVDVVAALRDVPCSEFTVERRAAINNDLSGSICAEIPGAPCQ